MKENWEVHWKDYYQILQVHPSAEPEVVKAAFDRLAKKYHPDVNHSGNATQRMKDLNEAYEILSDAEKRNTYHAIYLQRMGKQNSGSNSYDNTTTPPPPPSSPPKPKPEVNTNIIRFTDLIPGETRKDSFIIKNSGGPYSKVWISNTNSWLKIVSQRPLYGTGKLPLFIEIEAQGFEWGKTYVDNIIIKIDDVETHVRVELNTRPKIEKTNNWTNAGSPDASSQSSKGSPPPPPPSSQARPTSGAKNSSSNLFCQHCGKQKIISLSV